MKEPTEENDEPTEENNEPTEENDEKDLSKVAINILRSLKELGYSKEDTICILALASSFIQGEAFMQLLVKNATIVKTKMPPPMMAQPSRN